MFFELVDATTAPVEGAVNQGLSTETWINLAFTAAALIFAIWSWWSSNRSKTARVAAEKAERNADRRVEAAETSASELRKLVENLKLPPLVATSNKINSGRVIMLQNTTSEPIELLEILNNEQFYQIRVDQDMPFMIHDHAQARIHVYYAGGMVAGQNLHLLIRESGVERRVHVPIPYAS
ncbi:hypothetical protein [Arthrobacter sp. PAMC 25486]|uniref:hypothetical protein n=1 Tax=Arthrobacter sp. PAMC 25486 TaxID=1494608 RepID=UPI0012FEC547|nr:hypothetical protein [Arthrobacter sp. PAMC 25486]